MEKRIETAEDESQSDGSPIYEVSIILSNLQEHQLDALSDFIGSLEVGGADCSIFDIQEN